MAEDPEAARQQASIAALEQGRLPLAAQERIDELRSGRAAWTSDLSVAEMSAIRSAGFQPVGMVMGSSVYYIGAQWGYQNVFGPYAGTGPGMYGAGYRYGGRFGAYGQPGSSYGRYNAGYSTTPSPVGNVRVYPCTHGGGFGGMAVGGVGIMEHRYGYNWEHRAYESGVLAAKDAALRRILEEATDLRAHGVVGMRVLRRHLEGVGNSIEFTMIGTAIRRDGAPEVQTPFMSHLDGVAFGKLVHGGYVPIALSVGLGVIEVDPGCVTQWQLRSWTNGRVVQISDGIESARQLGIDRLETDITEADADGAVGVDVDFTAHEVGEAMLAECLLIGTAVRRYAREPLDEPPLPIMRLR